MRKSLTPSMPRFALVALYALFFLSGAAGLICEVIWVRWLTGPLGSGGVATSVVLAVFMAGLGAGSWFASRSADGLARPLLVYGLLELGVSALTLLPMLEAQWIFGWIQGAARWWAPLSPWLTITGVGAAALVIGPPTMLMGAGLPLVVRAAAASTAVLGRRTAAAYAANTLGGVCGALAAGFVLIESFGLRAACLMASVTFAAVGLVACWLHNTFARHSGSLILAPGTMPHHLQSVGPAERMKSNRADTGGTQIPRRTRGSAVAILFAAGLTGFCALGYETIWSRILSLLTLNTTYGFSLMLAVLLCGLSLGSWLISGRLDRLWDLGLSFITLQIVLANCALVEKCYGQHVTAAKGFAQALLQDPSDDLARYEMEVYLVSHAKQCLDRGLTQRAYELFQQALRVNPRSVGTTASLAALEDQLGRSPQAAALRRRARALDPRNGHLQQRLAEPACHAIRRR